MEIERIVFARLEEQSRHINNTFKQLGIAINAWLDGSDEKFKESVMKITQSEKKSRKVKDEALNDVARAISLYRSDFLRLVMKMEDCASFQGGAAARLSRLEFKPEAGDEMVGMFKDLVEVFIDMGDTLTNLMRKLGQNMEQARNYCDKIDLIEEKVDGAYRKLESFLYNRKDLDIRIIMQLREIIKHIEEACDHVQSTADSVRIILATH